MKKAFSKSKNTCKVTFSLPEGRTAKAAYVVGDFNGWRQDALPMKKGKAGYSATVELDPDQEYQYRFLIDGSWENDPAAEAYAPSPYGTENCVVRTRA